MPERAPLGVNGFKQYDVSSQPEAASVARSESPGGMAILLKSKPLIVRGSLRIRSGRGGGRRAKRCSRCYGKHLSGVECRAGIPGSTPPVFISQLLNSFFKTLQLI